MDAKAIAARRTNAADFGRVVETNIQMGKFGDDLAEALIQFPSGRLSRCTLGPRVCRVDVNCGFFNDKLLTKLTDGVLPHLVPWDNLEAEPVAYKNGRYVSIEAAWERHLQRHTVLLSEFDRYAYNERFIVGPNDCGEVIVLPIHDIIHMLVGGETGSGKSWTLRSLAYQLAGPGNQLVLLDGKYGQGLGICNGLQGQVGPVAIDRQSTIDALGWCFQEMRRRYKIIQNQRGGLEFRRGERGAPPDIIVVFDEFQVYTKHGRDKAITEAIERLATQGRVTWIHLILGTQKPLVGMFGQSSVTRDQLGAMIGGKVKGFKASEAIMDSSHPRCDRLLTRGDAYVKAVTEERGVLVERVQVACIPERGLSEAANGQPDMAVWPRFDEADLGTEEDKPGRRFRCFTPEEAAVGLVAAMTGRGVPWIKDTVGTLPSHRSIGSPRGEKLQRYGKDIMDQLSRIPDCQGVGGIAALPNRKG